MLLFGAAALPVALFSQERKDSLATRMEKELQLKEVVVVARRTVLRQDPDRITYFVKNDPYAQGLDCLGLFDRVPRISVVSDRVTVAGKNSVKYIVDGHLLEMSDDAVIMKLKNLQADGIEKIELLATPPAKYETGNNVAYISITTRNESLGTRGGLWTRGGLSDDFRYSLGGNLCHATRKVEFSADMNWSDTRGRNDLYREYSFADNIRVSDRINSFVWRGLGANGLLKYKFGSRLGAGVILNYITTRSGSDIYDITADNDMRMTSTSVVPSYPDNALTLTGFADWNIDSRGKMLSLTYNRFDKRSVSSSYVSTLWDCAEASTLIRDAGNRYGIHSVKLDAILPFPSFRIETGAAYTSVGNDTKLIVSNEENGKPVNDPDQSNHFIYDERTAAFYISAEQNLNNKIFGKISLRYEHTDVRGIQKADNSRHDRKYSYLFPTVSFSWNMQDAGRLSADYSMGISRPNFGDMNPFRYYTTVNDCFTGNPDLESVIMHNAGINYNNKGIYAVLYGSWGRNAIGYITRFSPDGMQRTVPENCLNTFKTGIYASYNRSIFEWWSVKAGGEIFYSGSKSLSHDYLDADYGSWSGKIELNMSWMLNTQKTLILNLHGTHVFPYSDKMNRYESRTLLDCELRYVLPGNRLTVAASLNDPFGWSVTRSRTCFADYTLNSKTDIHAHSATLRVAWSFGRNKVKNVYRDSKERESFRSY